ncbi:hypothetical protein SMACR_01263 [Sordaria macrospora]|uniref:WGS project CABT00000000 data, contig 2.4 n=2 Tax=Sordaria macrospora TaxID=5147 RepID=F7VQB4_SORMK|nr:uncharacterized protein SMAC_01263 [Sordaria macrospora k-hell]KAA8633748.1 hypothetical protein SMACR_01263 [Sordaria macrospora]KAH7634342.1 hypothetical protein B0T09DRAFT_3332 [Sordaria sp. MPI-SDFR-AT-0083]WPJ58857.1 hypothetical protein SMAC4_01263 [Sordaria macrospora]CCC07696.1 unnamed protein product [Sordaria macrospora k-hell]
MSSEGDRTGKAGIVVAPEDVGSLDKLACSVVDDLLYNILHDLVLKVHQDEKMARMRTAAIKVEKLAMENSDLSTPDARPEIVVETDAALYKDGHVTLKGNPLKTTKEILCPRCQLPRLLHPTDGKGAQKPDPNVTYCKRHPYIEKPGFDIYGQTWVQPGPGRGKKKKDMEKKMDPNDPAAVAAMEGSAKDRPPNVLSFPSATCSKCKRCILVTRLNNHMGSCIGNSGRNASRAAAQKISNGGSNGGSQNNDNTPPASQKGTPVPTSRATSPRKRDGDEFDEDGDEADPISAKKKKLKPTALPKKVILKTKSTTPTLKKEKIKTSSMLSVEQSVDDDDVKNSTVQVVPKKTTPAKGTSPVKKLKIGLGTKPQLNAPGKKIGKKEKDHETESTGTMSSPPR